MIKKITSVGNCSGLILDKTIKEISQIETGDFVNIKCSKNKIVITKIEEKNK